MSIVYLATDPECLAEHLAAHLEQQGGDFFQPANIVVANRFVGKWLRLWLARRLGVAINFRFLRLEQAIWEMLRLIDPRPHSAPLDLLNHESYRLMVLSVLLGEKSAAMEPLANYLNASSNNRSSWRRLWHLSDRLAGLIRDYEYHRQNDLIQAWIRGESVYGDAGLGRLEKSQREIFRHIIREPDGKRALLGQAVGKLFKTLPQYAQELMLDVPAANWTNAELPRQPFHLFGITHISALHWRTLGWLGDKLNVHLYYLNPLLGRTSATRTSSLRNALGQAGIESFQLLTELTSDANWQTIGPAGEVRGVDATSLAVSRLADPSPPTPLPGVPGRGELDSVLRRLQGHLLGDDTASENALPQDRTLQIVACPGVYREVETVYNSIVHNLHEQPDLNQTDIAVLVTDMERYRPALQAVFEREPRRVLYNLTDFSAAGLSVFGQALIEMLDLAMESFTRTRVFSVLLNPCFLARLKVDRTEAVNWLTWAETLGIYHGWNQEDKKERGYAGSPFFGWQLGLRRLRLGRVMEVTPDDASTSAARFRDVIPYADLLSSDKEQLDAFCRAVEGLLPTLAGLRKFQGTGKQWAEEIERLVGYFLDIPSDRPEEQQVRDRLVQALSELSLLDPMAATATTAGRGAASAFAPRPGETSEKGEPGASATGEARNTPVADAPGSPKTPLTPNPSPRSTGARGDTYPLPLIREYVLDSLEHLQGTRGEYLTGGVTISALHPFRQIPFRIIYVIGLGEDLFPGSNALSTFDLRAQQRQPGDIRPAEFNRYLFMEALLAARDKVYLLYNCRELQRDQQLHPSVPLIQVRRYIEEHITGGSFEVVGVPLNGGSIEYLRPQNSASSDVLVNYSDTERTLAALAAQEKNLLPTKPNAELNRRLESARRTFAAPAEGSQAEQRVETPTVTIRELERFLRCPAEAAIQRHLHLYDDAERDDSDDEPFLTDTWTAGQLKRRVLDGFLHSAARDSVKQAVADWPTRFAQTYEEWQLRCQAPESPFGDFDQAALVAELEERIRGPHGLAEFVKRREAFENCGPILIGESVSPIGARTRFPAITLPLTHNVPLLLPQQVRIIGSFTLAWRSPKTVELLVINNSDKFKDTDLSRPMLEPLLFFLALQAGNDDAGASRAWVGKRALHLHVAHNRGVTTFSYGSRDINPARAEKYLRDLVADFLDPTAFDMLPFDLIASKDLSPAFILPDNEAAAYADDYQQRLEDMLEEDADSDHPAYWRMRLMEIVSTKVPGDAFAKVRRRFSMFDRGPAAKRKKTAKEDEEREPARRPRKARRT